MKRFSELSKRGAAVLVVALAAVFCSPMTANAGEKTFGVKVGYAGRNESAVAGLFFQYGFSEHFRLAPEAECIFKSKDRDAFVFNVDGHFPFQFTGTRASLYPLVGVNYSSWNKHFTEFDNKDASERTNRFGLNCGAGFDLKVNSTLKINIEAKYTFIKANSGVQLTAGIGYMF